MMIFVLMVKILLFFTSGYCACVKLPDGVCVETGDLGHMTVGEYSDTINSQTYSLFMGDSSIETSFKDVPNEFKNISKEHVSGNFNCTVPKQSKTMRSQRKAIHHQLKHSLNQLALCPWKFVNNVDENRKPETLLEAVCACKFPDSEHPGLFCENVYQHVTVYRRSACEGGAYVYERVSERVSVACVTVALPKEKVILEEPDHSKMSQR